MKKFIAQKGDLKFSIETNGDKVNFFCIACKDSYDKRKDVTPEVMPHKDIINEIIARPVMIYPMSEALEAFIDELEEKYKSAE